MCVCVCVCGMRVCVCVCGLSVCLSVCLSVMTPLFAGINVASYVVTKEPVGVFLSSAPSGASTGDIANPHTLLEAARRLVEEGNCR